MSETRFLRALGIGLMIAACMALLAGCQAWPGAAGPLQVKQANVNGATLTYEEQGAGAPVVFVHGCCTDYRAWDAQRQAIAPHYRFIGLNLRYHGTAPWPDDGSKYSIQTHAEDIAAFIRGLNAGPVDLVGWSYSGLIVMLVTVEHPELVRSLTIHEPGTVAYVTDPATLKAAVDDRTAMLGPVVAAARAGDAAGAARLVPVAVNQQPDFWDTATPDTRAMFDDNARTIRLALVAAPPPPAMPCDQLRQIKVPVLITDGADTRAFYRLAAQGAVACIPGAQLVDIPGGRHLAIIQQPDAFNAAVLQFLVKAGSQPRP
ncbi:alpha/beta hydrolase [Ramlibacter sp. G-1-2-2]|uniref:Alpha/beta hydrolase n=1 Tax=Ramlibacter agri TaxID=2728837 RepID=A0A848GYY0_9BURK|nr:alpha/beta hydrolase [Ramlibacter agri]NML42509.1 alpha/beta hydrolase [Ramlibacter agri]